MNFQELGETLKRERESRGLSIKAVMEATKISRVNLLALESGDRSNLPHPVYTKGFVKSYARLLHLDPDELSMVVDREYQADEPETAGISYDVSPHAEKAFQDSDKPKQRKRSAWPSILIVIVLASAALILVMNLNKPPVEETPQVEPKVETSEQAAPPTEVPPEAVSPPAPENAEPSAEPAADPATKPAAKAEAEKPVPIAPGTRSHEMIDDEATDMQGAAPTEAKYAHVLIIRATSDKGCWIGVWRGDETDLARDFVLTKGEPLRLMFNSPRRIRIGNVSGVTVSYNGEPYPLDQAKGNIQTLQFGQ